MAGSCLSPAPRPEPPQEKPLGFEAHLPRRPRWATPGARGSLHAARRSVLGGDCCHCAQPGGRFSRSLPGPVRGHTLPRPQARPWGAASSRAPGRVPCA